MTEHHSARTLFFVIGGIVTVLLTMAALIPFLTELLKIEVVSTMSPMITTTPLPNTIEEQLVTVLYEQEEVSGEISAVYIEVFHPSKETIYYMEIPVQTKIILSNELYKSLQTYSPELPQYLKLSKMAEGFSKDYVFIGGNRILSELLGVSLEHYVSANKESLQNWMETFHTDNTKEEFFKQYTKWLETSISDLSNKERWMYYESYQGIKEIEKKMASGNQEVEEFKISSKQCRELLEYWKYLLRAEK